MKSTVEEIRARFDGEVERFSNLETGQTAAMDAPLALELIARAAAASTPHATSLLDVGCGAGNYSLKLLERLPGLAVTLIDLSQPMLDRSDQRLRAAGCKSVTRVQGDIRQIPLVEESFDVIVGGAVLHHMRSDAEWEAVYRAFFRALSPSGSIWVFDLISGVTDPLHDIAWGQYADHLRGIGGDDYRKRVFDYVTKEDTPRPLFYQLSLLHKAGFAHIEVLHKHGCFAAFGAVK